MISLTCTGGEVVAKGKKAEVRTTPFGIWLSGRRTELGLNLTEAAERIGYSHARVNQWETKDPVPPHKTIITIARKLAPEGASEEAVSRHITEALAAANRQVHASSSTPVGIEALSRELTDLRDEVHALKAAPPAPSPPPATDDTRTAGERKQGVPAMADRTLPPKTRRERDF